MVGGGAPGFKKNHLPFLRKNVENIFSRYLGLVTLAYLIHVHFSKLYASMPWEIYFILLMEDSVIKYFAQLQGYML